MEDYNFEREFERELLSFEALMEEYRAIMTPSKLFPSEEDRQKLELALYLYSIKEISEMINYFNEIEEYEYSVIAQRVINRKKEGLIPSDEELLSVAVTPEEIEIVKNHILRSENENEKDKDKENNKTQS